MNKVRLKDIAEICNISVNSVSRAMRNDPRISLATRAKVQNVAKEMGYVKDLSAATISSGKSGTIAIIVNNFINPQFNVLIMKIDKLLNQNGYNSIVLCVHNNPDQVGTKIDQAISISVDGVFYAPSLHDPEALKRLENRGIPYVALDRWAEEITNVVRWDDEMAGYIACDHLIKLGHKRFLYLAGPEQDGLKDERQKGMQKAMKNADIPLENARVVRLKQLDQAIVNETLYSVISPIDYTGIVSFNDEMAYFVMNSLVRHHIRIPEDVSIVGVDHLCGKLTYLPPLTSVGEIDDEVVSDSVRVLLQHIHDPKAPKQNIIHPVKLYNEGTTGAPRQITFN